MKKLALILLLTIQTCLAQEVVVKPYLQPGNGSTLGESDVRILSWITDGDGGTFTVDYGPNEKYGQKATITSIPLPLDTKTYTIYRSTLENLPFDSSIFYRVMQGDTLLRKASFSTRSKSSSIQFVVVGDQGRANAEGLSASVNKIKIAYQIDHKKPPMGIIVGDIVYPSGCFSEYLTNYIPIYINAENSSPTLGSKVLASSTFYFALGNHDIRATDFEKAADGLAAFYMWQPPLNGPTDLPFMASPKGPAERIKVFKEAAGKSYPALANYSFDNGPAHFLVLDANAYVNVNNPEWKTWIENDLKNTPAKWKFVFFHQPGFHSSKTHYDEQRMRVFSPLFEKCGVDVVFSGHVHNYQRSKPFTFAPTADTEKAPAAMALSQKTRVDGSFKIDEEFDGIDKTSPKGIIYIVTGSGGAKPYEPEFTNAPEKWKHEPENWAPYTTKFISDRSSFSYVTLENNVFTMQQVDVDGKEVDTFKITKP